MMQGTLEDIHERASAACVFYRRYKGVFFWRQIFSMILESINWKGIYDYNSIRLI